MNKTIATIATLTALFAPAVLHAIPPTYTFQAGTGSDDVGEDSDSFFYVTGSALFSRGLSRNSIVDLRAELSSIDYSDNSDRSGEEIFLEGVYSYTPRAGFQVPTYSLGLRVIDESLSSSDFDATTTSLLLYMSYPVDDRIEVLGGLRLDERDSSDDSSSVGTFINIDYRLTPRWLLYSTLNLADEDVDGSGSNAVGSGAPGGIGVRGFVSGGHLPSEGGGSSVASDSDNTFITLGASYALTGLDTIEFSVSQREYELDGDTVDGNILSLDYFHRF